MKRIKVLKAGVQTHGAEMEDPTAWIAEQVVENSWGKPERWVTPEQEDVSGALESRDVTDADGKTHKEYRLPAQYQVVIEDITAEKAQEKAKDDQKKLDLVALKAMRKGDIKNLQELEDAFLKLKSALLG